MQRTRGFTLLEMMVAIAILAVASSAVYFSNSEALSTQVRLEEKTIAQWALVNQVAYYRLTNKVENNPVYSNSFSIFDSQQVTVGGIDLEIETRRTPLGYGGNLSLERVTLSAYRNVDGKLQGPIHTYHFTAEIEQ